MTLPKFLDMRGPRRDVPVLREVEEAEFGTVLEESAFLGFLQEPED